MYQVRVSKPGAGFAETSDPRLRSKRVGHQFTISDLDCLNCALKMMERWEQLGYECELLALNCL